MVDAHQVDRLEQLTEALDPPAVALHPRRGPVVDRIAPELPGVAEVVGRDATDEAVLEELGVRDVVGAAASEPACDSDSAYAPSSSPPSMSGNQRSCCWVLPNSASA